MVALMLAESGNNKRGRHRVLQASLMEHTEDFLQQQERRLQNKGTGIWVHADTQKPEAAARLWLAISGLDMKARDEGKETPLLLAVQNGWEAIAHLILETNGVDIYSTTKDSPSMNVLSIFLHYHRALFHCLDERNSDLDSVDGGDFRLWQFFKKAHEVAFNMLHYDMWRLASTEQWLAADKGHRAIKKLLLQEGACLTLKDEDSQTRLWDTVRFAAEACFEHYVNIPPLGLWKQQNEIAMNLLQSGAFLAWESGNITARRQGCISPMRPGLKMLHSILEKGGIEDLIVALLKESFE